MRNFLIGLAAFLTLVDLFATQAILPALARAYGVAPAAMGLAVNASTLGMALAALGVAFFSRRIDRRLGIAAALALLALPTALLAAAPGLASFALLRIAQGLCMATAFALTLSYLAEHCSAADAAGAFAAYIAGNVASNLFGRLMAASLAEHLGIAQSFLAFAALNLAGAALVWLWLGRAAPAPMPQGTTGPLAAWTEHLRNPALRASFAIGFTILFAFIGTFSYVNFVLVREPLALSMMAVGLVYFVFLPAVVATPLAGRAVARFGARRAFRGAIAVAAAGLPLVLAPAVPAVLAGLALIGAGTFFAQATTTGFVGSAATADRGAASGIYLACYFGGGLAGTAVLGLLFDRFGWGACVAGIGAALGCAALLASRLKLAAPVPAVARA
jgi:predicted MFS family arabinose efflux permease